jgi:hypothetical protein
LFIVAGKEAGYFIWIFVQEPETFDISFESHCGGVGCCFDETTINKGPSKQKIGT